MGSSWGRLGVVSGAKSPPKILQRLGKTVWDVDFSPWASLRSFQEGKANDGQASDRSKRASGRSLGLSGGGVLGLLGGLLGAERHPFNDVQGVLGPFLAALGLSLEGAFGERLPFNDVRQKYKIHSSEA